MMQLYVFFSAMIPEVTSKGSNNTHQALNGVSSKLKESKAGSSEYRKQIQQFANENESLKDMVKTLNNDKARLFNKLQSADNALTNISNKVTSSKSFPHLSKHESSGVFSEVDSKIFIEQSTVISNSLDEIRCMLNELPNPFQHAQSIEVNHLTAELHRVNLQLVEEKGNVCQLKKSVQELEEVLESENEMMKERDEKSMELQKLRSKLQLYTNNDKVRKQLSREKKILQRRNSSLQKECKILGAMYQSSSDDVTRKDQLVSDLMSEKKQLTDSSLILQQELKRSLENAKENEKLSEKFKRESHFLLEKLNSANEERAEVKRRSELLEQQINKMISLADVKNSLAELQQSVQEIKARTSESTTLDPKIAREIEDMYKKNEELLRRTSLLENQQALNENQVENLQRIVNQKDSEIAILDSQLDQYKEQAETKASQTELNSSMNENRLKSQLENLKLENEILQSRILILEGISHEMEIITNERDALRRENHHLRGQFTRDVKGTTSDLILVNNPVASDPSFNQQNSYKLDELDEDAKQKLQQMLSTPEFEKFLSSEIIHVNLLESDQSCDRKKPPDSPESLSRESSFEKEHTINHMYQASSDVLMTTEGSASYEDVIQVYSPPTTTNELMEETLDYGYKENSIEKSPQRRTHSNQQSILSTEAYKQKIPSTPPPSRANEKNLEKLFSESKSITNDIAAKRMSSLEGVDYSQVLKEFHKVISHMSLTSGSNQQLTGERKSSFSRPSHKRVTFSDHVVDFFEQSDKKEKVKLNSSTNQKVSSRRKKEEEVKDKKFYKSFFQEALKRTYPVLSKYEDEDTVDVGDQDLQNDQSHTSSSHAPPMESNSLTDQALNLLQSEKE